MALFSSAVDTFLFSFPIRRFLFRSTVAPLRCCQPKKLGASLAKLYSPKCSMAVAGPPRNHEKELPPRLFSHQCVEGEFCEVAPRDIQSYQALLTRRSRR